MGLIQSNCTQLTLITYQAEKERNYTLIKNSSFCDSARFLKQLLSTRAEATMMLCTKER